ncbi:helix-turn-helix domain-containing protein [Kurthia massiliensis]|uniref:helix-turn-helix domain-containing protein n=1 Tax=Kurthia massiliensis TaxID=1033739 RepID=UPI00028801D4|nr:helix-turn-helix domain-containing protein [Kurthia massiliensis]
MGLNEKCSVIEETFRIPVHIIHNETLEMTFPCKKTWTEPFIQSLLKQKKCDCTETFEKYSTNGIECYYYFYLPRETVIVGPVIHTRFSMTHLVTEWRHSGKLAGHQVNEIVTHIPVIDLDDMQRYNKMIHMLLFNKPLTLEDPPLELSTNDKQHQRTRFVTYQMELDFLELMKTGDVEKVEMIINQFATAQNIGVLATTNALRNTKNLAIVVMTVTSRTAIQADVLEDIAFSMSDEAIQQIERQTTMEDVHNIVKHYILTFTKLIQEEKKESYSLPIVKCRQYIASHVYDDISLSTVAEEIGLHPAYISTLFKKEVGITLKEYGQQKRIEESKRLLLNANYMISDIAKLLHFHDQSHFTKVFKKITNYTPKQFRSTYL